MALMPDPPARNRIRKWRHEEMIRAGVNRMKKILLVFPKYHAVCASDVHYVRDLTRRGGYVNCNLATLAALTPPQFDVEIVDENLSPIDYSQHYDIVGIGGYPTQIRRAREIAEEFRRRGVLVVCGGPAATLNTPVWRESADVLVLGEAENVWPEFLEDYLRGRHRREYRELGKPDLSLSPIPQYSRQARKQLRQYLIGVVQCSRGCPFDCEFCNVIVYVGRKMRYKPVERIMKEIEQQASLGFRYIFLADDNFPASRSKSKAILRAIRDWNHGRRQPVKFFTQLSIDISKDDEFLSLAAEAGIASVFIGVETPSVASLKETRKLQNVRTELLAGIRRFHEYGIVVGSGSIVGFDNDDLSIFETQYRFFTEAGVAQMACFPLQAAEGTPLKERMIREGRYIGRPANFESMISASSIIPKNMTVEQLQQGVDWLLGRYYDWDNYVSRVARFFENFERSEIKSRLDFPRGVRIDPRSLEVPVRIAHHLVFHGTDDERRAFGKLLSLARQSSHPHRYFIAISSFVAAFNMRKTVRLFRPDFESSAYPKAESLPLRGQPSTRQRARKCASTTSSLSIRPPAASP
jgi:radical SAM superfamily enzyme YgiQ (UPF0313 family)